MHAVDSLRFLAIDRFVVDIQGGLPYYPRNAASIALP